MAVKTKWEHKTTSPTVHKFTLELHTNGLTQQEAGNIVSDILSDVVYDGDLTNFVLEVAK